VKRRDRTTFLCIVFIDKHKLEGSVVVGGPGGKARIVEVMREVHPDWDIQSAKRIKRPHYAVTWTGK
jgi:hypothetical protein